MSIVRTCASSNGSARTGAAPVDLLLTNSLHLGCEHWGPFEGPVFGTTGNRAGIINAGSSSARLPSWARATFAGQTKPSTLSLDSSGLAVAGYSYFSPYVRRSPS